MNFFRGIAGLFLYIGSLMSPVGESRFDVRSVDLDGDGGVFVAAVFEFRWDDDLTSVVNSGIPIIVKFTTRIDRDTDEFYRILRRSVSQRHYFVSDSVVGGEVQTQKYANIPLALRHFQRLDLQFNTNARYIDIVAEIQNSFVPSMEVYVDISSAFGGRIFSQRVRLERTERRQREVSE